MPKPKFYLREEASRPMQIYLTICLDLRKFIGKRKEVDGCLVQRTAKSGTP